MRILLAAKHLHFPQGGGGLERNTHELCLRLLRHGVTPAVMADLRAEASPVALVNMVARKLNPRRRFPMDDRLGYRVYRGWASEDGAAEVMADFKPDIVIAQSAEPAPLLRSFDAWDIPRMAYFHEVLRIGDVATLKAMGAIGLLANSQFTARKMMANGSDDEPAIIRPLIDPSYYKTPTRPRSVLFVNTQVRKGLETGLALAAARPDIPFEFVLPWILKGQDKADLLERSKALRNLTLHPPTNNMRAHYANARLVLTPSQVEEAWGRVATEAQINGIPVLSSDRGGLPEAVGPGGVLVPHDAPIKTWADALSGVWDDPARYDRLSEAALRYSNRPEVQPDVIVQTFIKAVRSFMEARP